MLSIAHEAAMLRVTVPELLALARWNEMGKRIEPARKKEILAAEGLPWPKGGAGLATKLGYRAHEVLAEHRRGYDWTQGPFMPEPLPETVLSEPFVPEGVPTDEEYDAVLLREHLRLQGRHLEYEPMRKKFHLPGDTGKWLKFARRWRAKHGTALLAEEASRIMAEGEETALKVAKAQAAIAVWRARGTRAKDEMAERHRQRMKELHEKFRTQREAEHARAVAEAVARGEVAPGKWWEAA